MDEYNIRLTKPYSTQVPVEGGYVYINGGNVSKDTSITPKIIDLNDNSIKEFDANQVNALFLYGVETSVITPETLKALNTLFACIQITDKRRRYDLPEQTISLFTSGGITSSNTLSDQENTLYDGGHVSSLLTEISGKPKNDVRQFRFVSNNENKLLFNILNYYITSELFNKVLTDYIKDPATDPLTIASDETYMSQYDLYKTSMDRAKRIIQNHSSILVVTYSIFMGLEMTYNKMNDDNTISFNISDNNSDFIIKFYQGLLANEYIVTDTETNIQFEGISVINVDQGEKIITASLKDFTPPSPDNTNKIFKLTMKGVDYYKGEYMDREEKITEMSKSLSETTDEHKGAIKTFNTVQSSFKYIDMFVWLMYLIVSLVMLMLILGQEDIKPIFSLVMIAIITIIYVIFLGMYSTTENFSSASASMPTTETAVATYKTNMDSSVREIAKTIASLVITYEPLVAVSDMYENILDVMQKDVKRLDLENDLANNRTYIARSHINQEWHDGYRSMAIVSALVIVSVIILGYYFLATSIPQGNTYFAVLAVIAIVFTVFYYYFKVSQNVRTRYDGYYWSGK